MSKTIAGGVTSKGERTRIKLDWRAYFLKFIEVHGEPMKVGGRLLFQDGWQYSIDDYQGPEYPPPVGRGQLCRLQLTYWENRRDRLAVEVLSLTGRIGALKGWQHGRSLPLQQRVIYKGEDDKGVRRMIASDPEDLDLMSLTYDLDDKRELLAKAELEVTNKLAAIRSEL